MDPSLYKAAMEGNFDQFFAQKQQELNQQETPNKNTVIHVAALFGNTESVKVISRLCPSLLSRVNIRQETALHIAAKEGHFEVLSVLIECAKEMEKEPESGAHVLAKDILRMTDKDEDTALHKAVRNHHCAVVKLLVNEDPEFAFPANKIGETPVYLATEGEGCEVCLSQILNSSTSPAYGGPCGRTALHAAVIFNLQGCVKILLDWKQSLCELTDMYGWSPLHYAALFGHVRGAKEILNLNRSVAYRQTEKDRETALHIAASQGHTTMIKLLLSHCPDCWEMVNVRDQNMLHTAVLNQKHDVIKFIINSPKLSSLISEKDIDGNTPLHFLATSGCHVTELINHHRANKLAFNNENLTPLDIAYSNKYLANWGLVRRSLRKAGGFGLRDIVRDEHQIAAEEKTCEEDEKAMQEMRKEAETSLIVAALIATVTFAAGFTLPGGYNSNEGRNQGMAILTREAAFKAFLVSDTIALMCSSSAAFVYFMKADYVNRHKLNRHYMRAKALVTIAMGALVLAFITGLYAVLSNSTVISIVVLVIGCCSFLVYYYELRPALRSIKVRPRYLYSEQTKKRGRHTYMLWGTKNPPQKFVRL